MPTGHYKHKPLSEERRKNISKALKVAMLGHVVSTETRLKMKDSRNRWLRNHPEYFAQKRGISPWSAEQVRKFREEHDKKMDEFITEIETKGGTVIFRDYSGKGKEGTRPDIIFILGDEVRSVDVKKSGEVQLEGEWKVSQPR